MALAGGDGEALDHSGSDTDRADPRGFIDIQVDAVEGRRTAAHPPQGREAPVAFRGGAAGDDVEADGRGRVRAKDAYRDWRSVVGRRLLGHIVGIRVSVLSRFDVTAKIISIDHLVRGSLGLATNIHPGSLS